MPPPLRKWMERRFAPQAVNFWCHVIEGSFASFGGDLVGGAVVMPMLVTALGFSPKALGAVTSLAGLAVLVQLLAAPGAEAAKRKKRLVLLLGIGQRLPVLLIAGSLLLFARAAPILCLSAIVLANLLQGMAVSVLYPPWVDLLAETVPSNRIGRLFGFRNAISSTLGLASAAACGAILVILAFPGNYAVLYLVAFGSVAVSWFIFALVDEVPESAAPKERRAHIRYFRDLLAALRDDRNYRYYLLYQAVGRTGAAAGPFYVVAAVKYHGVSAAFAAGAFMGASRLATLVGNLGLPFLAERIGHRRMIGVGTVLHAAAALTASLAPSGAWFIGVFFLSGLGGAAGGVSGMPFMMQVSPRGRRVGYTTFSMVALMPLGMLAAIGAGLFMTAMHTLLFFVAALLILAALLPLEHCRPPSE